MLRDDHSSRGVLPRVMGLCVIVRSPWPTMGCCAMEGGGETMVVSDIVRERTRRPGAKILTTPIHESFLRCLTVLVLHTKPFVRTTIVALVPSLCGVLEGTAAVFVCCLKRRLPLFALRGM